MLLEIPRCARNDSSFLGEGREKRRFVKNEFQKRYYDSNRRFSLFNNILACHSERSEESPGPFTISLKFDLLGLSFHGREDVYKG